MANLRSTLTVVEPGNPSTATNGDMHTQVQQAAAPTVEVGTESKTIIMALAAFFVIIFVLHKAEKWARKGVL